MKCFVLAFALGAVIPLNAATYAEPHTTRQVFQQFSMGIHQCQLRIDSVLHAADQPTAEAMSVICDGKTVLTYGIEDAGFGNFQILPQEGMIFVWWERGTGVDFTAFHLVQADSLSAKKIFEVWTAIGADVLPLSHELLVHHSKRFVNGESIILPKWTEKYVRIGNSYKLVQTYKWNDQMRWKDTYCILVPLTAACPASVEERVHPWDRE